MTTWMTFQSRFRKRLQLRGHVARLVLRLSDIGTRKVTSSQESLLNQRKPSTGSDQDSNNPSSSTLSMSKRSESLLMPWMRERLPKAKPLFNKVKTVMNFSWSNLDSYPAIGFSQEMPNQHS
jgi:hypothetical protein